MSTTQNANLLATAKTQLLAYKANPDNDELYEAYELTLATLMELDPTINTLVLTNGGNDTFEDLLLA